MRTAAFADLSGHCWELAEKNQQQRHMSAQSVRVHR
jgi:hypothetical protein